MAVICLVVGVKASSGLLITCEIGLDRSRGGIAAKLVERPPERRDLGREIGELGPGGEAVDAAAERCEVGQQPIQHLPDPELPGGDGIEALSRSSPYASPRAWWTEMMPAVPIDAAALER